MQIFMKTPVLKHKQSINTCGLKGPIASRRVDNAPEGASVDYAIHAIGISLPYDHHSGGRGVDDTLSLYFLFEEVVKWA